MGAMRVMSIAAASVLSGIIGIGVVVNANKTPEERAIYAIKKMSEAADEMKGQRVHPNVVFDGYDVQERSFTYRYTLTHLSNGRYPVAQKERLEKVMHEQVCGDRKLKRLLKSDGVIRYAYSDRNARELFTVVFDGQICGLES